MTVRNAARLASLGLLLLLVACSSFQEVTIGTPIQAKLDVVDVHGYWRHPQFPGRPWDPANWLVGNESMVTAPDVTS